jgi:hypothetical protein
MISEIPALLGLHVVPSYVEGVLEVVKMDNPLQSKLLL